VGDYCRIDSGSANSIEHNYYIITSVDQANNIITIAGKADGATGKPIVNFGQVGDNVGISINGSKDESFNTAQSISVFEFNPSALNLDGNTGNENIDLITPRIILGKLPDQESLYGYAAGTYGLYAENVLLKGSLVT
jgi:hypothetical protein